MKYLEELHSGDCFKLNNQYWILTTDFKKNNHKLAVNLFNGQSQWIKPDDIVESIDIFTLDKDHTIIAIKERKSDAANSLKNIS